MGVTLAKHRILDQAQHDKKRRITEAMKRAQASLRTIATTGTNGKTSTTHFVHSILSELGPAARISTIGGCVLSGDSDVPWNIHDKPGRVFTRTIRKAMEEKARWLAMEVTSKALMDGFARRWPPEVAIFTNLSRDHLDLHESPEAYLAAKAQLFVALGFPLAAQQSTRAAVLNASDEVSGLLEEVMPSGVRILRYGLEQDHVEIDLCIAGVKATHMGQRVALAGKLADVFSRELVLSVQGEFQAFNAVAAALATYSVGAEPEQIKHALSRVKHIDGRLQQVTQNPCTFVDYAHTPAALEAALLSARTIVEGTGGRLIVVFGCGGDRDFGKRPLMGAIANNHADVVWLTTDNARRESPKAIADSVLKGVEEKRAVWNVELDRRAAILAAVAMAEEIDLVLVAGKGHEREQSEGGTNVHFDDAEELQRAFRMRSGNGGK